MKGIKLLVFIVNHGRGEALLKLCRGEGIAVSLLLQGRGTVDSEIAELLGMGDRRKDVALLTVAEDCAEEVMRRLAEAMGLSKPGEGIAFSIPFSAAADRGGSYELLSGSPARVSGERAEKDKKGGKGGKGGKERKK